MRHRKARADQRKHHIIYKTTCLVTGRYYIGMHSTDDLDDGYLGSGKYLGYSLRKYGPDQHVREVLEHLPDRSSLKARERELITEAVITDSSSMNLALGGDGGWERADAVWNDKLKAGLIPHPSLGRALSDETKARISSARKGKPTNSPGMTGKQHTEESKQKIREAASKPRKPHSEETKQRMREAALRRAS